MRTQYELKKDMIEFNGGAHFITKKNLLRYFSYKVNIPRSC